MAPRPLSESEIADALESLPGWTFEDDRLIRGYGFAAHLPAVAFLVHVATVQEELEHHADLALTYNRLGVAVNTHSVGGKVTELDVTLARRVEALAPAHGAR
ncbi:4a-hydroxytetrahydrobiopterin dehydratase [Streptomyces sp. PT12]|uniref:4a-hydroxytetrahydrobiopterin dehydratase n=1 Tax=Streptomyces sp. PT12 TaxID=1510197 RepID=UPI000DE24E72|nr:4a-hydroxytetrahydrobiopterin dehydratase [Streptomyces sp. PT12]RBM20854.1 4a-hydroxytetrahydrobiopterin dehydratase [Streptomyces sp. PT12]